MEATYRGDLRELNELNFARFDAGVEQRFAALDAKLETLNSRFASSEKRLIGWMFALWTSTMLAQAAFLFAVLCARS